MKKRLTVLNIMLLISARTENTKKKMHFFLIFNTKVDGGTSKSYPLESSKRQTFFPAN